MSDAEKLAEVYREIEAVAGALEDSSWIPAPALAARLRALLPADEALERVVEWFLRESVAYEVRGQDLRAWLPEEVDRLRSALARRLKEREGK